MKRKKIFQGSCDLSWVIHIDSSILHIAEYSIWSLPNTVSELIKHSARETKQAWRHITFQSASEKQLNQ